MRIAVIGSSHVAAIKGAAPDIAKAYPDIDLTFFALPGSVFRRATVRHGCFSAEPLDPAETELIMRINGETVFELQRFDHLWVVGHRFGFGKVLQLLRHDILPHDRLVQLVTDHVDMVASQFGSDNRLTFSPAPYPALKAILPGPKQELRLARAVRHPDVAAAFARFESAICAALHARGYASVLQPAATRAGAFTTKDRFLEKAISLASDQQPQQDLRHMNAAYGLSLFQALAAQHLA